MKKWCEFDRGTYLEFQNIGGKTITIAKNHRDFIIEKDGYLFKDLNRSKALEAYKDWRLDAKSRALDLANRLSIEDIAGLMLYSSHQTVTKNSSKYARLFGDNTYGGKLLRDSDACVSDLSDQQKQFLNIDRVRHVLLSTIDSKEEGAAWVNNMQAFCESIGYGIPINICSDPRHGIKADAEYNLGAGSEISKWPEEIGLAATFDPEIVYSFGKILAKEYRSLGINTALSPQVDLATDPRWRRFNGTFGENTALVTAMSKAYCDGAQTSVGSSEIAEGWGYDSVNTMVKHWPGGGSGEGGRDAHYAYGKYAVYPGNNFEEHLKPFTNGVFKLDGKTSCASSIMPYYTISYNQDHKNHENVGNSYSQYIIQDLLRDTYGYEGVVCTDWLITADNGPTVGTFSGKCWGVEKLSICERHLKALEAGVDQFGGNNDIKPVLKAYEMLLDKHGKEYANRRFRKSAYRILLNMFRIGLFEQPYIDIEKTSKLVGNGEFVKEGYNAQRKSAILLKNSNGILPIQKNKKVYIPNRIRKSHKDWFGNTIKESNELPIHKNIVESYYECVDNPEEADFAIIFMNSPISDGYTETKGVGEYIPISLQYRPYKSVLGRLSSIGGEHSFDRNKRCYNGKMALCENEEELDMFQETSKRMIGKPLVVCLNMKKPCIVSEFEKATDAILIHSGIQDQALLDLISGKFEPSGLLPFQIPKNMEVVEQQMEDIGQDLVPYVDDEGNVYDFAYGRNYADVIHDKRTIMFSKKRL